MRVAVITPYYKESVEKLMRCHDSVVSQTHACTHFMIADGHPSAVVDSLDVEHIVLPKSHADNGNTPRTIGALSALNREFEAFAYLDADNWLHPDHVESLIGVMRDQKVSVAFSDRFIVGLRGESLLNEDNDINRTHVDTSCMMHTAEAACLIPLWAMMDQRLSPLCDVVVFKSTSSLGLTTAWSGRQTMYFESNYAHHYTDSGYPPPARPHAIDRLAIAAGYTPEKCEQRLGFPITFELEESAT